MERVTREYLCDVCGDPAVRGPYPKFIATDPDYRDSHARAVRIEREREPWYVVLTRPTRARYSGASIRQVAMHLCQRHTTAIEEALKP